MVSEQGPNIDQLQKRKYQRHSPNVCHLLASTWFGDSSSQSGSPAVQKHIEDLPALEHDSFGNHGEVGLQQPLPLPIIGIVKSRQIGFFLKIDQRSFVCIIPQAISYADGTNACLALLWTSARIIYKGICDMGLFQEPITDSENVSLESMYLLDGDTVEYGNGMSNILHPSGIGMCTFQ